jgi:pimeloyl-ACP methyl ester carboxylesterase
MVFLAPFVLILGLLQLLASYKGLRGVSLTGRYRRLGYLAGAILLLGGAFLLPGTFWSLVLVIPASVLALVCLVAVGSLVGQDLDPARFLRPGDWLEGSCQIVDIPNGDRVIPGLLITPPDPTNAAICLVHGSGDNKTAFKWRLISAMLSKGLIILTVDLAGHGENHAPQRWPGCTTEIPAALIWLREQPDVVRVGLLGVSMGGALSAHAAAVADPDALALCETPVSFHFRKAMVWREVWNTLRSPILDLMGEITAWQIRRIWRAGRVDREIAISDLIRRLDVPCQIAKLTCPLHLVYGGRDNIAPPDHGRRLHQVANTPTQLTIVPGASHLTLILLPQTTATLADWFSEHLSTGDT